MQSAEKSMKLPTFSGKDSEYQMWWIRFRAYATVYKFVEALSSTREADMPSKNSTALDPTNDAAAIKAKDRNNVAMANMTMAFTSDALMNLVFKAYSADWPQGEVYKVVEALET